MFILIETANENTTQPNAQESQQANKYIEICNKIMAGASLKSLNTKIEWTRFERHVIPIAILQHQTSLVNDASVFSCCRIRCNTALYNINTIAALRT